jgi:superfamily II DNA or RNA helicase
MPKIRTRIDTHLVLRVEDMPSEMIFKLQEEYTKGNPEFYKKRAMGMWTGNIPRKLESWQREGMLFILPRGTLENVKALADKYGYELEIKDKRLRLEEVNFKTNDGMVLRPYQEEVVEKLIEAGCNGTFRGPCGSGKTITLIATIAKLQQPTLVVVHSKALAQQWRASILSWLGIVAGQIEGGKVDIRPITIATQQSLWRSIENGNCEWVVKFGALVGDEIHHWAARTFQTVVSAFPAVYRFGASADERRKDGLEHLIYETFGNPIAIIEKEDLIRLKKLLPSHLEIVKTNYCNKIYCSSVSAGEVPDWVHMISKLTEDEERNALILSSVLALVKNTAEGCVTEPIVLILTERVEACKRWVARLADSGVEAGLLIGGPRNRQELEESIVRLRSGSLRVGVGTTVADEGLDIPRLTHVFLTCPVHRHPKRMGQMIGRAARPFENKTQAVCVYFWDWKMFPTPKSGDSEEKLESKRAEFIRSLAKVVNTFSVSSTK